MRSPDKRSFGRQPAGWCWLLLLAGGFCGSWQPAVLAGPPASRGAGGAAPPVSGSPAHRLAARDVGEPVWDPLGSAPPDEISYGEGPMAYADADGYLDGDPDFGTPCTDPSAGCCPRRWGLWGGVEYLIWWERGTQLPPLVTTSPAITPREVAGVLGEPLTETLFGGERVDDNSRSGGRLTVGVWIDAAETSGIGARFFSLEEGSVGFAADENDFAILARPFFNVVTDEDDALLISYPEELRGSVDAQVTSDFLATDVFFRRVFRETCNSRTEWLAGYLFTRIDNDLRVANELEFISDGGRVPQGSIIDTLDVFDVRNTFHGGEIGIIRQSQDGPFMLEIMTRIAFGNMRQVVETSGRTITVIPDVNPVSTEGGLLTQTSNIGTFERDVFTVVPELGVTLSWALSECLDLSVGYSLIYWNHVAQVGDQIDLNVNLTQQTGQPVGPLAPELVVRDSDYWLQGVNLGLHWRF